MYLPSCLPSIRHTRLHLPYSGSSGSSFPTFPTRATSRRRQPSVLCSAKTSDTTSRGPPLFTCSPIPEPASMIRVPAGGLAAIAMRQLAAPGALVIPAPRRLLSSGSCRISPVPGLPLDPHAPVSDPGGVASAHPIALETTAFRQMQAVGFPLLAQRYPLGPPLYIFRDSIRGLRTRYTLLQTPPRGDRP